MYEYRALAWRNNASIYNKAAATWTCRTAKLSEPHTKLINNHTLGGIAPICFKYQLCLLILANTTDTDSKVSGVSNIARLTIHQNLSKIPKPLLKNTKNNKRIQSSIIGDYLTTKWPFLKWLLICFSIFIYFIMVFNFTQFWVDGRPGNKFYCISYVVSNLLTPLGFLGWHQQWFETDVGNSSHSETI